MKFARIFCSIDLLLLSLVSLARAADGDAEGQPHGFFNPGRGAGESRAEACRRYYQTLAELDAFLGSLGYLKPAA